MALMIHQFAGEKLRAIQEVTAGRNAGELRRDLERLLAVYPEYVPALDRIAALHEQEGDYAQALFWRERAVRANTRNPESWVKLGKLHLRHLGDPTTAVKSLKNALEVEPRHSEAIDLLVEAERGRQSHQDSAPTSASINTDLSAPTTPQVTAIVSAYKSERFLRACLEDLEAQTIADRLEIIVVDSNSPQNERAIVEEFQKRYSNIVYIRTEERETVYGAWNRGVKAARGKYLTNANTDDRHRKDALEILARTLDQHPDITLVYADSMITSTENETFETAHPVGLYRWMDFDAKELLLKGCFCGPQPMWRREVHSEHGYFDAEMVVSGDYEFWLRLAQNKRFLHVKEMLGLYLKSPSSVEHANRETAIRENKLARSRYRDAILDGAPPHCPQSCRPAKTLVATPTKKASQSTPAVARIGNLDQARAQVGRREFATAWQTVVEVLCVRPFHPEACLLLAEIALTAGDASAARQCAQYAAMLAPRWNAAKQFLKKPLKGGEKPEWLTLPEQIRNPKPEIRSRLTVGVLTKNEERFIVQCLNSVKGLADQIIVVDTGSTDGTIEIAKSLGAEVYSTTWNEDFSAPRNLILEHATGDWILMLDADEELPADQHAALRADLRKADAIACRLPLTNRGQEAEGQSYIPRLFRNAPGAHYYGRIHEQVFPSLLPLCKTFGLDTALGTARLLHHGYSKELVKDRNKVERNLRLLRLGLEERPNDVNLTLNLGLELVRSGELEAGIAKYREAFRLMSAQKPGDVVPELREVLLTQFTSHLYRVNAHDEVMQVLNSALAKQGGGLTASMHFALGLSHFELKQYREAAEQMRQCLAKAKQPALSPINTDILTAAPHHCLALSLAKLNDVAGAEKAFQAGLAAPAKTEDLRVDYARFLFGQNQPVEALQRLNEVVQHNAKHTLAWRLGGEIALSQPAFLEFARDWTGEAARQLPEEKAVLAQRAEALLLSQELSPARPLWERACNGTRPPQALAAVILCATAAAQPAPPVRDAVEEVAVSRAFLDWYRRLVAFEARDTILQVNQRLDMLVATLPSAARVLESVRDEAARDEAITPTASQ